LKKISQIGISCFATDVGLSIWAYFKSTNYEEYLKLVKPILGSPDLEVQVYQVLVQTLTFTLLIFLIFHFVIYLMLSKEKKYALKYTRIYCAMASISAALMLFSYPFAMFLPLIVYATSFISIGKILKTKSVQETSVPKSVQETSAKS
jgi:hypothetical protein